MAFDPCPHKQTQIVLRAGTIIRQLKGLPEEKNITTLYNETAPLLGIPIVQMNSQMVDHLPSPSEMKNEKGEFSIPNKPCPKCGKITFLNSICQSCEAAEGGRFKSGYTCEKRDGGCGFVDEKTDEWIMQRLTRMKKEGTFKGELPQGMKQDIGIGILTDDGVK